MVDRAVLLPANKPGLCKLPGIFWMRKTLLGIERRFNEKDRVNFLRQQKADLPVKSERH
jgi:hypothetical protein